MIGESFTLLTMDAGPDVAPFHHRQIIRLARDWRTDWLDLSVPAAEVLTSLPEGTLQAMHIYLPPPVHASFALS